MPSAVRVPEVVRPAVEVARAEVEGLAPRYLGAPGPYRTDVVAVACGTHSTQTVLRISVNGRHQRFYLKTLVADEASQALKRSQIVTEHRLLEELSLHFQPYDGLGVITPVRCWPDHLSMLTEEFPGEKLHAVMARAMPFRPPWAVAQVATLCHLVGRWLSLFQTFTPPPENHTFDLSTLLRYCERRLGLLQEAPRGGIDGALARALSACLERLARLVEPQDLFPVGRQYDFRPDNILTDGERIAVLDFTGFAYGPRLYDFMKFWMQLEKFKFNPQVGGRATARWQQAFGEGYGAPVDLSSPLCRILQVANLLDRMSEAAGAELPRPSWARRLLRDRWYRAQARSVRELLGAAAGPGPTGGI